MSTVISYCSSNSVLQYHFVLFLSLHYHFQKFGMIEYSFLTLLTSVFKKSLFVTHTTIHSTICSWICSLNWTHPNSLGSPSRKMQSFLWLLQAKILDYAARFLKKCDRICGIFMQFYAMKLRELAKTAVWWKREKKVIWWHNYITS